MLSEQEKTEQYLIVANRVHYDSDSGLMTWKQKHGIGRDVIRWNAQFAGKQCGSVTNRGYMSITVAAGKQHFRISVHRLAWLIVYGELPKTQIDHINRNRSDNRISNLRLSDPSANMRNRSKNKNNTSGVTGVSWNESRKIWESRVGACGKIKHLGYFKNFNDAVTSVKRFRAANDFSENHGE